MSTASALVPALTILPDPPPPPTPMGLIAGGGQLPILIAQGLIQAGHPVHCLGLRAQYDAILPSLCSSFREVGLLRIGTWGKILNGLGVRHAIMVGKVDKARLMYDPLRIIRNVPDLRTVVAWYKHLRNDRRSHAVLAAVADELDRCGVALLDSTTPIPNEMAHAGVMTRTQPTSEQKRDIEFVWPILNHMLRLDVGQSIVVSDRDIVAVEAIEGTDRMIRRTGEICKRKGWSLVKGARAGHDRRSDVPVVGMATLENVSANRGGCIALAAGDVIMLEKSKFIERADELGIAIVGVPSDRGMGAVAPELIGTDDVKVELRTEPKPVPVDIASGAPV